MLCAGYDWVDYFITGIKSLPVEKIQVLFIQIFILTFQGMENPSPSVSVLEDILNNTNLSRSSSRMSLSGDKIYRNILPVFCALVANTRFYV